MRTARSRSSARRDEMSASKTADGLLRFPGEAPLQAQLKEWIDDTVDVLGDEYGARKKYSPEC